ncbi:MAG TPA: T9SS type A sorting domain-containing protein, partial [Chitinophagaceae bacterium]|nr:T9SS type A sorting domain-containing protein [Chitinophagaceae bacterium]
QPTGITTDAAGNIYVVGSHLAVNTVTPTANAYQTTAAGSDGIYFASYNSLLQKQYASYYDDVAIETPAGGIAIDPTGSLIIAGRTNTNPSTVFGTPGTHKQSNTGSYDGIIAKFEPFILEGILSPGCCIQLNYVYDAMAVANGTYHTSFSVNAVKASASDGDPLILPSNNFSVAGYAGIHDGFDGTASNTDDIIKTASPCVTAASPVTVAISFGGAASCGQSFGTATVTINNPNTGISLTNVSLLLNLTGAGSVFSGEPYNISNGLLLQSPNLSDPAYPAPGVAGQLTGYNGSRTLTIYSLPPGASTFNVDVALGSGATNLSATVQSLPTYYNPSGSSNTATGSGYTAAAAAPTVSINCPGSINVGSTIVLSGTTTGATSIQWSSLSNNNITNTGTVAAPQATYTPSGIEIAAGYADVTLRAVNASGCDNGAVCRVLINNVQRDFGDAPISFDLGTTQQPLAAASTKLTGLYLGAVDPDLESIAQPSVACDGDGNDEEGLRYYPATVVGQSNMEFDVEITNNSNTQGYLIAYIDWNEDGDFLDKDEQSTNIIAIPSLTGAAIYRPSFNIPFVTGPIITYVRLRLSSGAEAIRVPYGASPEGEVEDHVVAFTVLPVDLINFKATASGNQVLLSWQTATETNNDHFDIERSTNGSGWQKIGIINGYGNSSQLLAYSFTDYQPYDKSNYYRLKQVNSDRSFSYSPVRRINFESTVITRIYPNPVKDQLHIVSKSSDINYDVTITNISGQEVLRKNKVDNESTITVAHLPAGVYIIKLSHQEEQPKYYKVIKQ